MKTAGRVSPVLILGVLSLFVFAGVFLFSGRTPTTVASEFMGALGTRDTDTLAKLSYMPGRSQDEIKKEWQYTTETVAKHYRFAFRVLSAKEATETIASVSVHVFRNADMSSTYAEKFELPLLKVDDTWLVDIRGINREMYPGLPR